MKNTILGLFVSLALSFLFVGCSSSPWDRKYSGETFEKDLEDLQKNDEYSLREVGTLAAYVLEKQWFDKSVLRDKTYRVLLEDAKKHHTNVGGLVQPAMNIAKGILEGVGEFFQQNPQIIQEGMESAQRIAQGMQQKMQEVAEGDELQQFFQQFSQMSERAQERSGDWTQQIGNMFQNMGKLLDTALTKAFGDSVTVSFQHSSTTVGSLDSTEKQKMEEEMKRMDKEMKKMQEDMKKMK